MATAEATAFIARTTGWGPLRKAGVTAFIDALVTSSPPVWPKFEALWLMASLDGGTAAGASANLNLINSNFTLIPAGSPTFTVDQGYTGVNASTTVYLNTQFVPSSSTGILTQNSAHWSLWSATSGTNNSVEMGCNNELTEGFKIRYTDNTTVGSINSDQPAVGTATDALGLFVLNRSSGSDTQIYRNTTLVVGTTTGTASLGRNSAPVYILAQNYQSTQGLSGSARQIRAASIGGSLSLADVTVFYNALNTYMGLLPFGSDPPVAGGSKGFVKFGPFLGIAAAEEWLRRRKGLVARDEG